MNRMILGVILSLPLAVSAQGFANGDLSCYSWSGGDKSAGSFTQCHSWAIASVPAKPQVMITEIVRPEPVALPQATPVPKPKKIVHRKRVIPTCKAT